jgi:hypothetical protein
MHQHPRTERDLRWLAVNFSMGTITRGIPERLECLAAWHRLCVEADKIANGKPSEHWQKVNADYAATIERLHAVGVEEADGEFTFSPCCGPDRVEVPNGR